MELVDVPDSKSGVGNYVSVRPRPSANKKSDKLMSLFLFAVLLSMINYLTVKLEKICHPQSVENKQICVVFKLFRILQDASYTF